MVVSFVDGIFLLLFLLNVIFFVEEGVVVFIEWFLRGILGGKGLFLGLFVERGDFIGDCWGVWGLGLGFSILENDRDLIFVGLVFEVGLWFLGVFLRLDLWL